MESATRVQLDTNLETKERKQVKVEAYTINYILLGIPNCIYSSVDYYKDEKAILVLALSDRHLTYHETPSDQTRGDDEVELTDEEYSDSDNDDEVVEIFRIDTNVFDFETPTYRTFKEFNYLLQIDPNFLTKDIDTMEYGRNPLLLNIIVNHSYSRMDIRNGQLVAGKMMDIVMVRTFQEHT
ncbi:hypothetical protein Tco_0374060 [Tanacetum coccineum]